MISLAQPGSRLNQCVQYSLQIKRRPADHLEHVGGGGLLLKRFAQVMRALAQLVEQARVLDGDDGLVGKGGDQLDLLVGEWPDRAS